MIKTDGTIPVHDEVDDSIIAHNHSVDPPVWSCCGAEINEDHPKCPKCS